MAEMGQSRRFAHIVTAAALPQRPDVLLARGTALGGAARCTRCGRQKARQRIPGKPRAAPRPPDAWAAFCRAWRGSLDRCEPLRDREQRPLSFTGDVRARKSRAWGQWGLDQ